MTAGGTRAAASAIGVPAAGPDPAAVVAIDIGGTTVKGALVRADGGVLVRRDVATPAEAGGAAVTAAVLDLAGSLATGVPGARVVAAAAVTPGRVESGVVRYAANLGWCDVPLAQLLGTSLGVPAAAGNDVAGAALAESVLGGRASDCLFVALGTGVGAAHVRDGDVLPGATGAAGEIGHIPVYPGGEPCGCGQRGCLERYASAAGVARRYRAAGGAGAGVDEMVGSADAVVARLGRDPVADRVWREAVDALALALATAVLLLDPGTVVLGGGLAGAGETLRQPLLRALAGRLAWRPPPPVELSTLGSDAGWRGAALCAWRLAREGTAAAVEPPAPGVNPAAADTPGGVLA